MITISLPNPTPKEVWKAISSILRQERHTSYLEARERLIIYVNFLEQDYHIDSDYLWRYYVVPQI